MIIKLNSRWLEKSVKKYGISEQVKSARALSECQKITETIFGQKVKNQMKPLYLKNKVIYVSVTSSVLATEMKLHQKEIIEGINKKLDKNTVTNMRFLV